MQKGTGSLGADRLPRAAGNQDPGHKRAQQQQQQQHYHKLLLPPPPPLASDSCLSPRKNDSMSHIRFIFVLDQFPSFIHHVALQKAVLAEHGS